MSVATIPQATPGYSAQFVLKARVNDTFIPATYIKVEQTSYGISDTIEIRTPMSLLDYDLGALSQQVQPLGITTEVGYLTPSGFRSSTLIYGIVEEIENDADSDTVTIHGRGLLANLVDSRVSVKPDMNSSISTVIRKLISSVGLTGSVADSGVLVGNVLQKDYVSTARNLRALDFIQILARQAGWTVRAVGKNVVVGPPPDPSSGAQFSKDYADGDFISCKTTHNALHNRNIKVKVVSYHAASKKKTTTTQGPVSKLLGLPPPKSTAKTSKTTQRAGFISGLTTVGERTNVEEYVIPIPNKTAAECIALAQTLRDDINRHEFVLEAIWLPKPEDYAQFASSSPDFNLQLTGFPQVSSNGMYYMKHVVWEWDVASISGLTMEVEAINHPLPVPSGGQANASLGDIP